MHRAIKAAFLERLTKRVNAMRIGDPLDPLTQVGPVVSEQRMHKVLSTRARPRRRARVLTGGHRVTAGGLAKLRRAHGVRRLP